MPKLPRRSRLLIAVLLAGGCSQSPAESGVCAGGACNDLTFSPGHDGAAPLPDLAGSTTFTFVVDSLTLPSLTGTAPAYKYDVDGSGKARNQLASVMDTLATFGAMPQPTVDQALKGGLLIELLQVTASDPLLQNDTGVRVSGWAGSSSGAPSFDGSDVFGVRVAGEPDPHVLEATVASGHLDTGRVPAAAMPLGLPLPGAAVPLPLTVYAAHLSASVVPGRASGTVLGDRNDPTSAVLHGGISLKDVHEQLVPAVAALLQSYVAAGGQTAVLLLAYFDLDGNGVISPSEVETNAIVASLIAPDCDLFDAAGNLAPGSDNVKDALSFGVGITAVPAHFPVQP